MSARLVSIIGPVASGKTSLAERLAEELPAHLIREDYAGNPFLAESYTGCEAARLPGQLYFFMSRLGQLSRLTLPADGLAVSDYGFCQDRVFARTRLSADEYERYDSITRHLEPLVQPPAVVVALDAPEPTLLRRIAQRGRGYESVMTDDFLAEMRRQYAELEATLPCPVLHVDGGGVDLRQSQPREELLREIRAILDRDVSENPT